MCRVSVGVDSSQQQAVARLTDRFHGDQPDGGIVPFAFSPVADARAIDLYRGVLRPVRSGTLGAGDRVESHARCPDCGGQMQRARVRPDDKNRLAQQRGKLDQIGLWRQMRVSTGFFEDSREPAIPPVPRPRSPPSADCVAHQDDARLGQDGPRATAGTAN